MDPPDARSGALPGVVLGLGLGGFVDGIVLHQLLQWHHMVSSVDRYRTTTIAGLEANTVADGIFSAAMFLLVALGVGLLWRDARHEQRSPAGRLLLGSLIVGWGAFNVLDEVVNHALLGVHHIREGDDELAYDMAFLAFGVVELLVGSLLVRSGGSSRAVRLITDRPSR